MGKFDYQNAAKTALRLIDQFGQSIQIVRVSGDYDPVTGTATNETLQVTTAVVVSLPASGGTVQAFDNKFKEDLKKGKIRFFYIAAKGLGFEPEAGDLLLFEGGVWDIGGGTPLNPAGVPVLFAVGCRSSGKYDWATLQAGVAALEAEMAHFGTGNIHDWE
tara:strand:+ start:88 stop:570 length:483 start_codon:yes stop_codon:yes gene_type:complete